MNFIETVHMRKSVRSFSTVPVPRELIENIIEIATHAPTNCNQQLWNFIVIDDSTIKERLIKEAAGNTLFRRAPVLIAVTYDGWNYKEAIQGASLAVGHMLLAATHYGISGSALNSYGTDSKVKHILNIPEHETICCFVTLGFPDESAQHAPRVPRKDTSDVIHWNAFKEKLRPPFTYDPNDWSLDQLRLHQRHYCRKTFLGKEMDLAGSRERALVRDVLKARTGPFLDLMSYDGSYLREFPSGDIDTLDLTKEVAEYTYQAGILASRSMVTAHVYEEGKDVLPGRPHTITLIFKAERLANDIVRKLFGQTYETLPPGGEFVIIARRRPSLFSAFLSLLRLFFGEDIRKTGLYAFFGPYRPVRVSHMIGLAKNAGFTDIRWSDYFAFPSFFEQVYQMIVQYTRSEGSSYLHRDRKSDIVSKSIDAILSAQGSWRCGILGSVVVMVCKK